MSEKDLTSHQSKTNQWEKVDSSISGKVHRDLVHVYSCANTRDPCKLELLEKFYDLPTFSGFHQLGSY